jgi:hypothetical protein
MNTTLRRGHNQVPSANGKEKFPERHEPRFTMESEPEPFSILDLHREQTEGRPLNHRVYPEFIKDLQKSGLSDETILANGIYCLLADHPKHWRTREIAALLGWKDREKTREFGTVMVIPYRDLDG